MKRTALTLSVAALAACTPLPPIPIPAEAVLDLSTSDNRTRSADPSDEERISNLNIVVFNEEGLLEEQKYLPRTDGEPRLRLLRNARYSIYVCANLGYALPRFDSPDALRSFRYYLTYPDEYSAGLPMTGCLEDFMLGDASRVSVRLVRMMSKISLKIDRRELDDNVSFTVSRVDVGNCPRSASLVGPSKTLSKEDVLRPGFSKSGNAVAPLNRDTQAGLSGSLDLWMLENLQGDLLEDVFEDSDKVLEGRPAAAQVCSYVELRATYRSGDYRTKPGEYLIYRFYLGENLRNFDIERNCHYTFTLTPRGSGIDGDGWRVDKSALTRN